MKNILSNNEIRSREVYLILEDGMNKKSFKDAMITAKSECLDLVQVSVKDGIPVCKLLDKNKYAYELKKKAKNSKVKRPELKEVRMTANTEVNDIKTKEKNICRLLEKGHNVKVSIFLRGRERANKEYYIPKLEQIVKDLADVSETVKPIKIQDNYITVLLKKK